MVSHEATENCILIRKYFFVVIAIFSGIMLSLNLPI